MNLIFYWSVYLANSLRYTFKTNLFWLWFSWWKNISLKFVLWETQVLLFQMMKDCCLLSSAGSFCNDWHTKAPKHNRRKKKRFPRQIFRLKWQTEGVKFVPKKKKKKVKKGGGIWEASCSSLLRLINFKTLNLIWVPFNKIFKQYQKCLKQDTHTTCSVL